MSSTTANDTQRRSWNDVAGPKWLRHEAMLEARHAPISELLLAQAAPRPGEHVLEIGCGTGTLLARLAGQVAPGGSVTGIDIAATMLDRARARLGGAATLFEADAQTASLPRTYDLLLSRFGVMFFDDPPAAFARLRAALAPRGRLCFVCWAPLADNPPWRDALDIAVRHVGPPERRDPQAPGPFALADPAHVRSLLHRTGFAGVELRTVAVALGAGSRADAVQVAMTMGPAGALLSERAPDPSTLAAIRVAMEAAYAPGQVATVHLVQARPARA